MGMKREGGDGKEGAISFLFLGTNKGVTHKYADRRKKDWSKTDSKS